MLVQSQNVCYNSVVESCPSGGTVDADGLNPSVARHIGSNPIIEVRPMNNIDIAEPGHDHGRTTTMLHEAIRLARTGKAVFVGMANFTDALRAATYIVTTIGGEPQRLDMINVGDGTIHVISCHTPTFDWQRLAFDQSRGHDHVVTLIDHAAVDAHFKGGLHA